MRSAKRRTWAEGCARSCQSSPPERSVSGSSSQAGSARPCACSRGEAARAGARPASVASPLSTATREADVGHVPPGPHRLTAGEWVASFKRAFKEFMADDCMGLSQQIAYSSLLAFFPAIVLRVGLLGLIGAYED